MTNYPPGAYEMALSAPDEAMLHAVPNEPPVKIEREAGDV